MQHSTTPDVIRSRAEYRRVFPPSVEAALAPLPLSESEREILRAAYPDSTVWIPDLLARLILCEYTGTPLAHAPSVGEDTLYERYFAASAEDLVELLKGFPLARSRVIGPEGESRGWVRQIPGLLSANRGGVFFASMVLAYQVPQPEYEELLSTCSPGPLPAVPYSVGFIRFMPRKNGVVQVLEFRSELLERTKSEAIREKYADWDKLLIAALENYVATATDAVGGDKTKNPKELSIVFPSAEAMVKRYREQVVTSPAFGVPVRGGYRTSALSPEVAKNLFEDLPKEMGYRRRETPVLSGEFRSGTLRQGLVRSIKSAKARGIGFDGRQRGYLFDPDVKGLLRLLAFGDAFDQSREGLLSDQLTKDGIALSHSTFPRAAIRGEELSVPSMCWAPSLKIDPHRIAYLSSSSRIVHERLIASVLDRGIVLPEDFTPISKGRVGGAGEDWWSVPSEGQVGMVHLEAQNRHPSLRFTVDGVLHTVGCKGAGVAVLKDVKVEELPPGVSRIPIYRRVPRFKKETFFVTHDYWGGMSRNFGEQEMRNLLGLHAFVDRMDPTLHDLVRIPVKLSRLLSLPVWDDKGAMRWTSAERYEQRFLKKSSGVPGGLVTLETYGPCDVRISQLVAKLFECPDIVRLDPDAVERELGEGLGFLYRMHGKELKHPAGRVTLTRSTAGDREILSRLADIAEENDEAARYIFGEISQRSIRLLGLIHGAGGHVGGGQNLWTGTPNGGSISARNMDLRGGFNDFDASVLFPWIPIEHTGVPSVGRWFEDEMQIMDLAYWRESMNWLQTCLFGAREVESAKIEKTFIGPKHDLFSFGGERSLSHLPSAVQKRDWSAIIGSLGTDPYYEAFNEGRRVYREII